MQFSIALAALLLPNLAMALGLGEAQGKPIIGQPLRLEIPIINTELNKPEISCFAVRPPLQDSDGISLPANVRIELAHHANQSKLILTASTIRDPIISFSIKAGCGSEVSRDYLLLPDIEKEAKVPVAQEVALPSVRPITPKTVLAPTAPARVGESIQLSVDTTLEKLARERYPSQPKAREKFMRMMMVANPGVTDTAQISATGTSLQIPKDLPISRSVSPRKPDSTKQAKATPPAAEPQQRIATPTEKKKALRQDTLVIGENANGPEQQILTDLERLIPLMKEQNLYQDAMMRKIAFLEEDYSRLQQRFAKLEERLIAIDKELLVQKSTPPPTQFDVIELMLATLFGGAFAGLAMLLWQKHNHRRNSLDQAVSQSDASIAMAPTRPVQSNPIMAASAAESQEASILGNFSEMGILSTVESVDPVAEADVLMAYGRDGLAEEILLEGLKTDPTREAIHLKLLEIYANRKDVVRFEAVTKDFLVLNGGQGGAWSKVEALARSLGMPTGVAAAAAPVIAEISPMPAEEPQEDFFVGSLEFDFDLGTPSELAVATTEQAASLNSK